MKTPSDELFRLIKSLTGQEKRYLKLYASRHVIGGESKYMLVFDAIERQEQYDEEAIRKKFSRQGFTKQFTVIKSYLYDLILKSLEAYNAGNSADSRLKSLITRADILFDKALYNQCEGILSKAERVAEENENFPLLLEVISRKLNVIKMANFHKASEEELEKLYTRQKDLARKISNYAAYDRMNNIIQFRILKKGWITRDKEEIKRDYDPIMNNERYAPETKALSSRALLKYYHTCSVYHYLEGNMEKSNEYSWKLLRLFNSKPALKDSAADEYIAALNNIVYNSIRTGAYKDAYECLEILKGYEPKSVGLQAKAISSVYLPEMIIYNSSGRLYEAIGLIPEIEKFILMYGNYVGQRDVLYLYYNCACACFKIGDFKRTANYLARIRNNPDSLMLPDISSDSRILTLMVQYELGDMEILPYTLRSSYRYLIKQQRLHKFEKHVISFIRKLTNVPQSGIIPLFNKLKDDLSALAEKDAYEKYAVEYFGFIDWLNSKIEKKPITEIIHQAAKRK